MNTENNPILTIEHFVKKYREFVKEWFVFKCKKYDVIDYDEFWSTLLEKFFKKDILNQYNPSHYSEASFETWLKIVLINHCTDLYRNLTAKKQIPYKYSLDQEDDIGKFKEPFLEENLYEEKFNWELLNEVLDEIVNDKTRLIIKLKLYHENFIKLSEIDLIYLSRSSKKEIDDLILYISESKKEVGLRNKDVAVIMNIPGGSISTTFNRNVRKLVLDPYKRRVNGFK